MRKGVSMSDGLMTAVLVVGLILLLEVLDILGAVRRRFRGELSASEQDEKIRALEQRVAELERKQSS